MAFLDLCRLCGTDTLNIVRNAIFEGEGRDKKYAHKIAECLTLQVAVEDKLPKIMCGECSYKLDLLSEFRDKAYKTESQLLSKIDVNKVKAELPDVDDSLDLDNDDAGGDEDDFDASSPEMHPEPEVLIKEEERPAEKRRGRKPAAKRSLRETESEEEEEAPPKKRGRKPKQATAAAATTSPAAAPPKENTGKLKRQEPRFICHECGRTYKQSSSFFDHLQTHKPPSLECAFCGRLFCRKVFLASHVKEQHLGERQNFQCHECGKQLSTRGNLARHRAQVHHARERSHECALCGKRFGTREFLERHTRTHTGEKPYACELCEWKFVQASQLRTHKMGKHGVLPYACAFCTDSFRTRRHLKHHSLQQHHAHPPYLPPESSKSVQRMRSDL